MKTPRATITNLTPRNEKNGIAEITIKARNQHGAIVLISVTEAIVKINYRAFKAHLARGALCCFRHIKLRSQNECTCQNWQVHIGVFLF